LRRFTGFFLYELAKITGGKIRFFRKIRNRRKTIRATALNVKTFELDSEVLLYLEVNGVPSPELSNIERIDAIQQKLNPARQNREFPAVSYSRRQEAR